MKLLVRNTHDANFVVTGGTADCHYDNLQATSDDKVGIMTTLSFSGWMYQTNKTSNGSWCMGIKGEMSGTVCVTFTWDSIYIWVVYRLCFFCCLFIIVTWWYVWCIEWASGNQEEVQACLVTLWLFIISFSKSDILAWPVSNLSAAPVMHGCIPARGGFEWVIRCEFSAD